jgi:hypothetical protein
VIEDMKDFQRYSPWCGSLRLLFRVLARQKCQAFSRQEFRMRFTLLELSSELRWRTPQSPARRKVTSVPPAQLLALRGTP